MKKLLLQIGAFCAFYLSNAQPINVNTSQYTVPQLVQNVLFGSSSSTGSGVITNISWSTGSNFGSVNGIGYFTNTNTYLPISSGVLLVSGSASAAVGPNNSTLNNGSWPGDIQLFNYIDGLGIDPGLNSFNNATIIEFDFIPLVSNMSFNFVFASEEYGLYQCSFSDAFAFFVNDVTAGTLVQNIALVPNTSSPISVVTIRNSNNNSGCPSVNPQYFGNYFLLPEGLNPNLSPTNFNGQTVLMTASANVTPNHTYHMKLVVADRNDSALDSGVFISEGSFDLGQQLRGMYDSVYENYKDFTVANGGALCNGDVRRINLGEMPITGATYEWYKNSVLIANATSYFYDVSEAGEYSVKMRFPNNGEINDSFLVELYPPLPIDNPVDLYSSNLTFDLTNNISTILNGQNAVEYEIYFYNTFVDAQNVNNQISNPNVYNGFDGQVIYVSVENSNGCREIKSFTLYQSMSNVAFDSLEVIQYPNPVDNVLHLKALNNIETITILNLLGQELYAKHINQSEAQIDFSKFTCGTYLVKLISENASKVIQVIKN
jgi:large repetitive protein